MALVPLPAPFPSPDSLSQRIIRRLTRNLSEDAIVQKLREAEQLGDFSEREKGFWLLELKRRKAEDNAGCESFEQFVRNRTGIGVHKAKDLVRVAEKLERLPILDEALSRREVYWTAVRAVVAVAKPWTDRAWTGFCKRHRVDQVEAKVASSREGDHPDRPRSDFRAVRHPYRLLAKPVLRQLLESGLQTLSLLDGRDVTLEEMLAKVLPLGLAALQATDGKDGEKRKLPTGYARVIYDWLGRYAVPGIDEPEEIDAEAAEALLEEAEVIDLGAVEASPDGDASSPAHEHGGDDDVAAAAPEQPAPGEMKEEPCSCGAHVLYPGKFRVFDRLAERRRKVRHAKNLCKKDDRKPCPKEERDDPNTNAICRQALARDGYICRIHGCGRIADRAHHIEWLEYGGRTVLANLVAVCRKHHELIHAGKILVSGTASDLRISDMNGYPLEGRASDFEPIFELEVEPAPLKPEDRERPPGDDDPPASGAAPPSASASPPPPPPPSPATPALLPATIDAAFWRAHVRGLEWRRDGLHWSPDHMIDTAADHAPAESTDCAAPEDGPASLAEFFGQARLVGNLTDVIRAGKMEGRLPPHILLAGPGGVGKTTIAKLIAKEIASRVRTVQGPALKDLQPLVKLLPFLKKGDVLFIDEMHAMSRDAVECLYQALDRGEVSLDVTGGVEPRVTVKIEKFLLVAATTDEGLLPKALRSRFGIRERLTLYSIEELGTLAVAHGKALGTEVEPGAAALIALAARGIPREARLQVDRARAEALLNGAAVTYEMARAALAKQSIDENGHTETDRAILGTLVEAGRPLGLRSIADSIGETIANVAEVYEPYLFREKWLIRTIRGRVPTEKARRLFGK